MGNVIAPEVFSDLIGAIYDCVLAPEGWQGVIEAIREEFGFVTGALGVTSLRGEVNAIHASSGMADEELLRAARLGAEMLDLWGGPGRIQTFPLDEPIICSQVTDPGTWTGNPYFQSIAVPRDIYDGVAVGVARSPALVGHLGFGVHRSFGTIDESYVAGLRLVAPHIRRAVTISDLFDLKKVEAATFGSLIDTLVAGVVLVDEKSAVVHANSVAATMFAQEDSIGTQQGRLRLAHPAAQAMLEAVVRQAALDETKLDHRGIAVPVRRRNGDPLLLHVLPLRRGEIRGRIFQRAVAALFIAPAATPPRLPTDALALLYDLTPAEARVFELVCDGCTQAEIGPRLGIALSTVKTHLLHVFEKTGCRRQTDLVKLAATFSLPV